MIEAKGLTKRFGKVEALAGLDLEAPSGSVLAILGPNGAGKTTTVRVLGTLIAPTEGSAEVAGIPVTPKAVAAVIPTLIGAYGLFLAFITIVRLAAVPAVDDLVWQPAQIVAVILFAPLLATFSIWVGLAISVRSSDVRVAQQLSGLAVLPMVGLLALFTYRVVTPSVLVAVVAAAVPAMLDLGAWRIVSAMFDRERLLTRYGRT